MSTPTPVQVNLLPGFSPPHTSRSAEDAYDSLEVNPTFVPIAFGPSLAALVPQITAPS